MGIKADTKTSKSWLIRYLPVVIIVVCLMASPLITAQSAAYTKEQVYNGGFSSGLTEWTQETNEGLYGYTSIDWYSSGGESGGYVELAVSYTSDSRPNDAWANAAISQSVYLTGVDTLVYFIRCDFVTVSGTKRFQMSIDGTNKHNVVLSSTSYPDWTLMTVDVRGYTGYHTIKFYVQMSNAGKAIVDIDSVSAMGTYSNPTINSLSVDVDDGLAPLTVQFTSSVSDGFPTPTWHTYTWGDGTSFSGEYTSTKSHTYSEPGTYTVTFEVFNAMSSKPYPSVTKTIYVRDPPPSSIEFDESRYLSTETAHVTTHIKYYEPDKKTYYLRLYDFDDDIVGSLRGTWPISSEDAVTSISVSSYPPGNYAAYLYESDAGIGNVLALATAEFSYTAGYQGKAYDAETETPLSGVAISFVQSGITKSTTTDGNGEFFITGLASPAEVTISASKEGYTHSPVKHTPSIRKIYTVNLYLLPEIPDYSGTSIGGLVSDAVTGEAISGATVTLTGASSATTTTSGAGYYVFSDLNPGTVYVGASATGYRASSSIEATLTENVFTKQDISLTPIAQDPSYGVGYGVQYPPHNVKFTILSAFGSPISGVTVLATPLESSGPWAWLEDLLGIPGSSDIKETVLSGITGSDGGVTFAMVESIRYRIDVDSLEKGISSSITIYPKEDETIIYVWPSITSSMSESVDYSLTATPIDDDNTLLSLTYKDKLAKTSNLTFYITNESGGPIYSEVHSGESNISISYTMENDPGNAYIFGFDAQHSIHGRISQDQFIRFTVYRPIVDFAPWVPIWVYNWVAIGLIFCIGACFGFQSQKFGVVIIPIFGLVFTYIGWLATPMLLTMCAMTLGVLIYVRLSEGETGA